MSTLADIRSFAQSPVMLSVDDATPAGHFIATALIPGGKTAVYLLAGTEGDNSASVKGRVELPALGAEPFGPGTAYIGTGLRGGSFAGSVESYEATFLRMV